MATNHQLNYKRSAEQRLGIGLNSGLQHSASVYQYSWFVAGINTLAEFFLWRFGVNNLFSELCNFYHVTPRRVGGKFEAAVACPGCGKQSVNGQIHFSFSEHGGNCFVCGYKCGLNQLAKISGMGERDYIAPPPQTARTDETPQWFYEAQTLVRSYETHAERISLWMRYKPLLERSINSRRLGVGILPQSRCTHDRLIVPLVKDGVIVGLRGRAIACDCGKWLPAKGTKVGMMPLYNLDAAARGQYIFIVENPVDALMVTERTSYLGVASYSVAYWTDEWTARLKAAHPKAVIVAYDNDLPGNGGGVNRNKFIASWMQTHSGNMPPPSHGVKLVNKLIEAGLPAMLYDWGNKPEKFDIGQLLMEEK